MLAARFSNRPAWADCSIVFFLSLAVYLATMPTSVTLEDDGLFILSAYFNGISHPPGYPLHTLLGHLFTQLPFGTIAYRVHLLSAVLAALASVLVWQLVWSLVRSRIAAYVGALSLAWSSTFWSQAIIAEVYTLNCLLFAGLLLLAVRIVQQSNTGKEWRRLFLLFALLYGLALTNHWPLIVLSTPALMLVLLPVWRSVLRQLPLAVLCGLVGLLPYLWMYLHSQSDPFVSFYGPIADLQELKFFIAREGYGAADASVAAGLEDKLDFIRFFFGELLRQVGVLGLALAVLGFVAQFRLLGIRLAAALILVFVCNSLLLIALLGFEYDEFYQSIFSVYPLLSYMVLACWIALGAKYLFGCLKNFVDPNLRVLVFSAAAGVLVLSVLINAYPANDRSDYAWGELYATTILDALGKNAVLIADDDISFATISYMRYVKNHRPDVDIYNTQGFVLKHRLFRPFRLTKEEEWQRIDEFVRNSSRPIYAISDRVAVYGEQDFILFKRLRPDWPNDRSKVVLGTGVMRFLYSAALAVNPVDSWTRQHRRSLLAQAVSRLLPFQVAKPDSALERSVDIIMSRGIDSLEGQLQRLGMMQVNRSKFSRAEIQQAIEEADKYYSDTARKSHRAKLAMYKGDLAMEQDNREALRHYEASMLLWRHPDNPVKNKLLNLLKLPGLKQVMDPQLRQIEWLDLPQPD